MVFDVIVFVMRKVHIKLIVLPIVGVLLQGCYTWPSFVIGDSSGYISYDRNTRKLEVLWEKHIEVKDSLHTASLVDSIQDNKQVMKPFK
jgi:hypothetical protein